MKGKRRDLEGEREIKPRVWRTIVQTYIEMAPSSPKPFQLASLEPNRDISSEVVPD